MELSENARKVLAKRYLKRLETEEGGIESPEEMFRRVARSVASAYPSDDKKWEDIFYGIMTELKFLPNSPTLMNAGRELGQLAACFVLPVEDSMEGIFEALKNAALIHKSGGGTGFSFSRLRPKNSKVGSTGGVASGPVSFMKIFDVATEQVKQGGTRRGANMGILRVDHPDIMEFITCKRDGGFSNFNISVSVTDRFMDAYFQGLHYELVDPRTKTQVGSLSAGYVFQELVNSAWETGDPGIIFIDRINQHNPTPSLGEIEATNPCGEQPLLPYEACILGSLNLSKFVKGPVLKGEIDFSALEEAIFYAVRFLDNAIDASKFPLKEVEFMAKGNRKIGLGVMGFADMLFHLGIPYNSEEGIRLAENIMSFINTKAHEASAALAEERGVFPNYEKSIYAKTGVKYRNAAVTTIAPTGTLSIIAGCSSGIEPVFALSYSRNVLDGERLVETNPYLIKALEESNIPIEQMESIKKEIISSGSLEGVSLSPDLNYLKQVFVTAHEVEPEWHVKMQAAFQRYTDNAVSKTVNLPNHATPEDVSNCYLLAYELGCKGITIYRDGSKKGQVLVKAGQEANERTGVPKKRQRPDVLPGFTQKIKTGLGTLYLTVTELEGRPFEVFAVIGKSGRSTTAKTEAIGRLVSLALRHDIPVEEIVDQLKGIGGEYPVFNTSGVVLSIPDAIAKVLEERYLRSTQGGSKGSVSYGEHGLGTICPECGGKLAFEEGCVKCYSCGFNKCS